MSAFIVGREHIRFIVEAARCPYHSPLRWHVGEEARELSTDVAEASRVGQMLWDECVKSVQHRYPRDTPETLPGPAGDFPYQYGRHKFLAFALAAHPLMVIQACHCYAYQSCEHPGWEASEARAFIDALERRSVDRLMESVNGLRGVWEVRDAEAACRWRPTS
jgi:hypothetical protein